MSQCTTRREFIRSVAAAGIAASVPGCRRAAFTADPGLPNIVLITADDLGWKELGCFGNGDVKTPNIDRLARGGVRFINAFVAASSCSPSRASIITGQYPHTNGVTGLTHVFKRRALPPFYRTLPSMLANAGYNTALAGKWHVSPYLPVSWYGYNERLSGMLPKEMLIRDGGRIIDFIQRNRANRFYLEINYMNNHRDDDGEFAQDPGFPVNLEKIHVPKYWALPDWPEIREETARYYSQTGKMDSMIGEVLDTLDRLDLSGNTMVIFVSDNGAPFPGNKMTLYDRGIGTPLIIRWPSRIRPGRFLTDLASTIDIMPTVLEAAGIAVPGAIQGASMLPQAVGRARGRAREAVFAEMTDHVLHVPMRAVRTNRWKYIRNYSDSAVGLDQNNHMEWAHRLCELPNQPWKRQRVLEELYDLAADPNEQKNRAESGKHAPILAKMRALLDKHMKDSADPFHHASFTTEFDPELYRPSKPGR